MKCIKYLGEKEILRVDDIDAMAVVALGKAEYTNKQAWKKQKRLLADAAKAA